MINIYKICEFVFIVYLNFSKLKEEKITISKWYRNYFHYHNDIVTMLIKYSLNIYRRDILVTNYDDTITISK